MIPHSADKIVNNKWLVDELRVELGLLKGLDAVKHLIKTLKALCTI
jgi:hypothetical protein